MPLKPSLVKCDPREVDTSSVRVITYFSSYSSDLIPSQKVRKLSAPLAGKKATRAI